MNEYPFAVEVSAIFGMFPEPGCGPHKRSLPVIPASTARGIVESVYYLKPATIEIVSVVLCREPSWVKYGFNSHSYARKTDQLGKVGKTGNASQFHWLVLEKPVFIIVGVASGSDYPLNHGHRFTVEFARKIKRGSPNRNPSMGCNPYCMDYISVPRTKAIPYHATIPLLGEMSWRNGKERRMVFNNVVIRDGVVSYSEHETYLEDGVLRFRNEEMQERLDKFYSKARPVK